MPWVRISPNWILGEKRLAGIGGRACTPDYIDTQMKNWVSSFSRLCCGRAQGGDVSKSAFAGRFCGKASMTAVESETKKGWRILKILGAIGVVGAIAAVARIVLRVFREEPNSQEEAQSGV